MDERLEKALDFSNYMVTLNNQKRLIKEQYAEDLVYYFNGGQFAVTSELISFCFVLKSSGQEEHILVDDNDIPISIESIEDFFTGITDTYFGAVNKYHAEYSKLKKNRSVESIMNL
tara:strand:+ start:12558 stop:12905 length:348 start_codon:yes stop_codon:yes gene_type:complete